MDLCSYHVSLGSTRTIPFLEDRLSLEGRYTVSGTTCVKCVGVHCPHLEKERTAGFLSCQKSNCKDCKYN